MVDFDQNGGTGGASLMSVYLEYPYSVSVPTREGYTFLGYYTSASGGTQIFDVHGNCPRWEFFDNYTLYAQWKANSYKYILDAGAFSNELAVTYGQVPKDLSRVPVAENKRFLGYFDEAGNMIYNEEGKYVAGTGYAVAGNTVLTAEWADRLETISLVAAKQRWPWNGKVDVTYVADALKADCKYVVCVEMTVTEADSDAPVARTVSVAIPSENGERTLVADFGGIVAVETLDAGASVVLHLMKGE